MRLVALISGCLLTLASFGCAKSVSGPTDSPAESSAALAFVGPPAIGSARDSGAWWLDTFGTVDPAKDNRVRRAQEVFKRVAAAADSAATGRPNSWS